MSSMIVCPGCGTETDYRKIKDMDSPQCTICGKLLLAEVLQLKQDMEREGIKLDDETEQLSVSETIGRKLKRLGDDDLFGELDPFELEEESEPAMRISAKEEPLTQEEVDDKDNIEDRSNSEKKFTNPMEKSNLMKKLKEDQDLFGSLDN